MDLLFVKTTLAVPGAGALTHIAELQELEGNAMCNLLRMIEADSEGTIVGVFAKGVNHGMMNDPQQSIPHPRHWGELPDIEQEMLTQSEFEGLWEEAIQHFSHLQ